MSRKRQRESSASDTRLVEIYEDLANLDEKVRLKAAHTLITSFVAGHEIEADEDNGKRLDSILTRLIRGLCSGRKAARIGFSVALTELLLLTSESGESKLKRSVPSLHDPSLLLKTLRQQTTVTKGVSGHEQRDHYLGRLFGVEAIIRSGVLFHDAGSSSPWAEAVDIVLQIALEKTGLREQCGYMLYAALEASSLPHHEPDYASRILDKLHSHRLAKTPEGIAIWLAVLSKYPKAALPMGVWHHEDPLSQCEKTVLAQVLREAPSQIVSLDEGQMATQTGRWNAKVHFAWHVVLSQVLSTPQARHKHSVERSSRRLNFEDFWIECVDKGLFIASSSQERKYWGFLLCQQVIAQAPPHIVAYIFSRNFMQCFINHLALPDRYLHRAAEKTRRSMIDKSNADSSIDFSILTSLMAPPHGVMEFDAKTKTKTVEVLLARSAMRAPKDVVMFYQGLVLQPATEDDKLAASRRKLLVNQLVNALRSSQGMLGVEGESLVFIRETLSLLAKLAYYDLNVGSLGTVHRPIPAISSSTRALFRVCISSYFSHAMKDLALSARLAEGLVSDIHRNNRFDSWGDLLLEADINIETSLEKALLTLLYLKDEDHGLDSAAQIFRQSASILISMSILQIHNGDLDAVTVLEDLNEIFNRERFVQQKNTTKRDSTALVEIVLSLVSKPSLLLRRLTQQVFAAFAADIDSDALLSMIKVLETKESLAGQAEIFVEEDGETDVTDASDAQETDISSLSSPSLIETHEEIGGESGESIKPETTLSSQFEEVDEELAAFDAKLAQALGTRLGQEHVDADISSSSSEDMNDQQMEELDEHLESMFRERKNLIKRKHEQKEAKETIINFKSRVLELLGVYIKQEHASIRAMDLLLPILSLIRTTSSPVVSRKAYELIRIYSRLCKGNNLVKIQRPDTVMNELRSIHDEAGKEASNAHAVACSQASLLLVRALVSFDRGYLREIIALYANTQERVLFEPSFKAKVSFFMDWSNWCNNVKT